MIRVIKSILSWIRSPLRRAKSFVKRHARKIAIGYLASLLPMNIASLVLTTPASLFNPKSVIAYAQNAGVLNFLTGGTALPILNGAKTALGNGIARVGDIVGAESIIASGRGMIDSGREWFEGLGEYSIDDVLPDRTPRSDSVVADGHAPEYYVVNGPASIPATCPQSGINYVGRVDELGRIGTACGVITADMVEASKGHREKFAKDSDPAGWGHNGKVTIPLSNGKQYKGYFWNRSHLIADSLGGNAIYDNLITGTRMQNVGSGSGGMRYSEKKTQSFVESHPSCPVTYAATPQYQGDEIVPRSVRVDMLSCDGSLNESVIVQNVAEGYKIDYNSGRFE